MSVGGYILKEWQSTTVESSEHPHTLTYVFGTPSLEARDNLKVAWLRPRLSAEFLWRTELCTGYLRQILFS